MMVGAFLNTARWDRVRDEVRDRLVAAGAEGTAETGPDAAAVLEFAVEAARHPRFWLGSFEPGKGLSALELEPEEHRGMARLAARTGEHTAEWTSLLELMG